MKRLNLLEETRFEKLPVAVYPDPYIASKNVAQRIAARIRTKQQKNEPAVLGLAIGATPIGGQRTAGYGCTGGHGMNLKLMK